MAANALTDEVTIDIAVRIVTDDSFMAELKLVSNLGAAATMSLRDLFLVGTLRLTLNPLIVEWPCFRWARWSVVLLVLWTELISGRVVGCIAQRPHPVLHVVSRVDAPLWLAC